MPDAGSHAEPETDKLAPHLAAEAQELTKETRRQKAAERRTLEAIQERREEQEGRG
jgi:hypothetical protein